MSSASRSGAPGEYVLPQQFAAQAGISLSTVHRYLASGRLTKIQRGGKNSRVWIPVQELSSLDESSVGVASVVDAIAEMPARKRTSLPGRTPEWKIGLPS
ncbi:hypothetical protein K227x_14960 [Rubripirellula lacrimiformis]|uniref:Helix-turn-helix domain protein n=1 Tax=Rubripirellula lacrimiformis TaxID=1930273 RepID=A0A517N7J5_9BACT|nr:hypothetical protein K227x_14960 [Rubripirellula lacrimiformis]